MILHVDMNCFYASCAIAKSEGKYNSSMPLAVAGDPERRHGIILAATYPAKVFGIRAGMPLWEAKTRCPELIAVPADYRAYMDYSDRFMAIMSRYSPLISRFGIDEAYMDYGGCEGLFGSPERAANTIRERVKRELDLTVSVGIGRNPLRAKMGSDHKKPDAVTYLDDEAWKRLIWPKPVEELMYVGRAKGRRLRGLGICTIEQLAHASSVMLMGVFGSVGRELWEHANGIDERKITGVTPPQKCISHSATLPRDIWEPADIAGAVLYQTERVAFKLREMGRLGRVVGVHLKYSDLSNEGRQTTLERPTDITDELYGAAKGLIAEMTAKKPVRQVGVSVSGLTVGPEQITLFDGAKRQKQHAIDAAADSIRKRYGSHSLMRARTMCFDYDPKEDFTPFTRG